MVSNVRCMVKFEHYGSASLMCPRVTNMHYIHVFICLPGPVLHVLFPVVLTVAKDQQQPLILTVLKSSLLLPK